MSHYLLSRKDGEGKKGGRKQEGEKGAEKRREESEQEKAKEREYLRNFPSTGSFPRCPHTASAGPGQTQEYIIISGSPM